MRPRNLLARCYSIPLLLLVFLFSAIVTRTFVQGFGVLIAIFVCVFVIPTPFVRPPGPFTSGIREELFISGLDWTALTSAKLAAHRRSAWTRKSARSRLDAART